MVTAADGTTQASARTRTLAGYAATVLGGLFGGLAGGWAGFGAGAWFGDRFVPLAEHQSVPIILRLIVGASAGEALVVWICLRGFRLGIAEVTAVTLGAFVPLIFAAPLLWGRDVEISELLVTLIGVALVVPILSRAAASWIVRTRGGRAWIRVAAVVWLVELAIWTLWLLSVSRDVKPA
jgi:hypothetical protein